MKSNMKKILLTIIALLSIVGGQAKDKVVVWENPTTEYGNVYGDGYFNIAMDVNRVEMKETETKVSVTVSLRSDYDNFKFQFASGTYLLAEGKRYALVSANGIELDKYVKTNADNKRDIVFHFQPMPLDTKVFDFIEGDSERAFKICGIRSAEERHKMLFPSYWRNETTGNWDIAFLGDYAIYDCKIWDMKAEINENSGEADITMTLGNKTLNVKVGKDRKGFRSISINGKKGLYSMITDHYLPDYPTKDTRTDFVDSDYKRDTVTVIGWLKDMSEEDKKIKTFEFSYFDIFTNETTSNHADLDSLGRFTIKIPIINTTEFFCDWERCFIRTLLEPGKTYFMLCDFKEGRKMFMGEDARLQNELFKYPLDWTFVRTEKGDDFDEFIAKADSLIKTQHQNIDKLCSLHPTLSTRFNIIRKGNTTWQQANEFVMVKFHTDTPKLPDNARKYAYENFWKKLPKPYTLHRDINQFIETYINDMCLQCYSFNVYDHIDEIATTKEESERLWTMKRNTDDVMKKMEATTDAKEKERILEEYQSNNAEDIKWVEQIFHTPHAKQVVKNALFLQELGTYMNCIDSLGTDETMKCIWASRVAYREFDSEHKALAPELMDTLKTLITIPDVYNDLVKKNEYYIALANRQLDKLVIKTGDDVAGMTEGEKILKKLLEPYKGKIVLIDVWGTWCGPCKAALSHSQELYERLSKYDIQYVYFANRSPKDSWENVIKEYNVTGPNVAHFNLPEEQQSAIERYLKVNSFPTYKLVGPQGNVLDIKVSPYNLQALEEVIKQLTN